MKKLIFSMIEVMILMVIVLGLIELLVSATIFFLK